VTRSKVPVIAAAHPSSVHRYPLFFIAAEQVPVFSIRLDGFP
jgi:hypothetical protein